MRILLIITSLGLANATYAQIGATEKQLLAHWKILPSQLVQSHGSTASFELPPRKKSRPMEPVDQFALFYKLDQKGRVCFEQWNNDFGFDPITFLKRSEPGYTWTERDAWYNWIGTAPGKQDLHARYQHILHPPEQLLWSGASLYIAPVSLVPDKGEEGAEFWDYMVSP